MDLKRKGMDHGDFPSFLDKNVLNQAKRHGFFTFHSPIYLFQTVPEVAISYQIHRREILRELMMGPRATQIQKLESQVFQCSFQHR